MPLRTSRRIPISAAVVLVFVFALTEITALMAADLTPTGILRAGLVLAIIWWCWVDYSWLANIVKADEGVTRASMLLAMAAVFVLALSIPESFDDLPGGLYGQTTFAIGYATVRAVHIVQFAIASRGDSGLRRQVLLFTLTMVGSTALLLAAARTDGTEQTLLWGAVVLIDYGGTLAIGNRGWRVNSATHFAERHGLIILVALGESIVAIGVGIGLLPVSWPILIAALLGLSITVSLWWAYFDITALRAERARGPPPRRHGPSRLHLPASSHARRHRAARSRTEKVLEYVAGQAGHHLSDPLQGIPLLALYGGVALFLLSHVAFGRRTYRQTNIEAVALAGLLLALLPLASHLPAIASLTVLAVLLAGLNLYQPLRHPRLRHQIRHQHH
jgi:low temperature requirement protein LtrA